MTDTTNANGSPRHLGPTREVPLVGYLPKHDATLNRGPRSAGPNAVANGSNKYTWPLTDADPTRRVQALPPRPPVPNVTVEPPMAAKDARRMEKILGVTLVVVLVVAAVALVLSVAGVTW